MTYISRTHNIFHLTPNTKNVERSATTCDVMTFCVIARRIKADLLIVTIANCGSTQKINYVYRLSSISSFLSVYGRCHPAHATQSGLHPYPPSVEKHRRYGSSRLAIDIYQLFSSQPYVITVGKK